TATQTPTIIKEITAIMPYAKDKPNAPLFHQFRISICVYIKKFICIIPQKLQEINHNTQQSYKSVFSTYIIKNLVKVQQASYQIFVKTLFVFLHKICRTNHRALQILHRSFGVQLLLKKWSELLPQNDCLFIHGSTYVHWYDCITDYIF
ncbi:MAG: hypothetical protein II359_06280, partial [Clostridia bacterium]|nr:hypothetical protein [Clostridia bacterium]